MCIRDRSKTDLDQGQIWDQDLRSISVWVKSEKVRICGSILKGKQAFPERAFLVSCRSHWDLQDAVLKPFLKRYLPFQKRPNFWRFLPSWVPTHDWVLEVEIWWVCLVHISTRFHSQIYLSTGIDRSRRDLQLSVSRTLPFSPTWGDMANLCRNRSSQNLHQNVSSNLTSSDHLQINKDQSISWWDLIRIWVW